jgi:hypothetical protein
LDLEGHLRIRVHREQLTRQRISRLVKDIFHFQTIAIKLDLSAGLLCNIIGQLPMGDPRPVRSSTQPSSSTENSSGHRKPRVARARVLHQVHAHRQPALLHRVMVMGDLITGDDLK